MISLGVGVYDENMYLLLVGIICFVGGIIIMEHERHIKQAVVTIVMMLDEEIREDIIRYNKEM
jgi:hypothetical protein